MNRVIIIFVFCIYFCTIQIGFAQDIFPQSHIKNIKNIQMFKSYSSLSDFNREFKKDEINGSSWSTLSHRTLDSLLIDVDVSSFLGKDYIGENITDGKTETAWVEGTKGNGIGEWARIHLLATKDSVTTTPFGVYAIGITPGHGKNRKTWVENNRVKSLLIVIETPHAYDQPGETKWEAYKLDLLDKNELQVFNLPPNDYVCNETPMESFVWVKILGVYDGTKYNDTCISEIVLIGGSSS